MIQPALILRRRTDVSRAAGLATLSMSMSMSKLSTMVNMANMARLICFAICLSSAVVARAEDVTDPKKEAEYQELINYALEEYDRGSWEESAALFHRAHELAPSARTLRGLGLATYEARRYAESVRHLRAALSDKRRPLTDKQREEVQHTLDRAKLFVGHLLVELTPRDAQLTINGRVVEPETDGGYMVDSGFVDLEANAPGYLPVSRRMRIGGGEQQRVVLRLASASPVAEAPAERSAPAQLPEPAQVAVTTQPDRGTTSDAPSYSPWKWVAGAGAVVALAAGGTMLAMQKAQAPAYERECNQAVTAAPDCDERHTYLSTTLWTGSIVGLSLGGALTALSVTLFVLDANSESSSNQNHVVMACGGGPLGIACRGQF